jgi:hypothetical protein
LASTPPLAYRRLSLPRIDVKNEEQLHFTPFGQMIVPNDRKILQRKRDSSSLSKSPILKNTRPAPRPPPVPLFPTWAYWAKWIAVSRGDVYASLGTDERAVYYA